MTVEEAVKTKVKDNKEREKAEQDSRRPKKKKKTDIQQHRFQSKE